MARAKRPPIHHPNALVCRPDALFGSASIGLNYVPAELARPEKVARRRRRRPPGGAPRPTGQTLAAAEHLAFCA